MTESELIPFLIYFSIGILIVLMWIALVFYEEGSLKSLSGSDPYGYRAGGILIMLFLWPFIGIVFLYELPGILRKEIPRIKKLKEHGIEIMAGGDTDGRNFWTVRIKDEYSWERVEHNSQIKAIREAEGLVEELKNGKCVK